MMLEKVLELLLDGKEVILTCLFIIYIFFFLTEINLSILIFHIVQNGFWFGLLIH